MNAATSNSLALAMTLTSAGTATPRSRRARITARAPYEVAQQTAVNSTCGRSNQRRKNSYEQGNASSKGTT